MKIVPADATILPNVASVKGHVLKLKPVMTALSKADVLRLQSAADAAPKGRRSKSAPSKMRNDVTFENVTMRRKRGSAKGDRGQPPSRKPSKLLSAQTAQGTTKRGTRRRSNTADAASAPNVGLKLKPKKNVSVDAPAESGPWLRSNGSIDGDLKNSMSRGLGARQLSKKPADCVDEKRDTANEAPRKQARKRRQSKRNGVLPLAGPKAKAASDATNERPRRHPRMSLLPGGKPAKNAISTTRKVAPYVAPLVAETRALTPAEIKNCRYTANGRLDERFLDAKTIVECGGNCGCDRRCVNRATQRDPCPYLELVVTPDKGIGVRATNAITMHAYVMEYLGEVIPFSKTRRTGDYVFGLTGLWGEEEFFIDAEYLCNKARFINREELSFDYHEGMSAEQLEEEFRGYLQNCQCGAGEKCRGKL